MRNGVIVNDKLSISVSNHKDILGKVIEVVVSRVSRIIISFLNGDGFLIRLSFLELISEPSVRLSRNRLSGN